MILLIIVTDLLCLIKKLNSFLSAAAVGAAATGACVYVAGSKTYCAVLSKANCDTLSGVWTENGKCP